MFEHGKRGIEKCRKDHEIDSYIIFSCREYFLFGMLIEKQKVSLMESYALSINDVHSFSLTHVDEFYVVVGMKRKVYEAHMRTHIYELAILQNS